MLKVETSFTKMGLEEPNQKPFQTCEHSTSTICQAENKERDKRGGPATSSSAVVPLIEHNASDNPATGETNNSSQSSASQNKETSSGYPPSIQFGTLPPTGVPNILEDLSTFSDPITMKNVTSSFSAVVLRKQSL
ncbi:hypothetical protein DY000_02019056 [Brassica cretica]|uniref:Uncharacterized protein n=1 Tax=Brassica cretica TaxID=69181 RepID=A0ABQ7D5Y1_BRACR|nr:hypothetical protein DY000_02019056 [Brassica cretica]